MKKIQAAIIGCGRISVCYADAFSRLSDMVDLTYAVDKDIKRAQNFAEKFGCQYASDLNEIKGKNIDVLHLCLPHYLHAPVAIQAMRAGINVLTEKPVSSRSRRTVSSSAGNWYEIRRYFSNPI